jgi:alkanesulfonate monooxygenase SsuD/methylene tetrahydromethanopterin reductase-like flavin-dependent oxidoreductase (luciferase family)
MTPQRGYPDNPAMRFGIFLPPFAEFAEPRRVVSLARQAEDSGWDGLFLWDHMLAKPGMAVADPWVVMGAEPPDGDTRSAL